MNKYSESEATLRAGKRAGIRESEELIKKGNQKVAKGEREKKSTMDKYKDVDASLKWEGKTNFLLRIGWGAVIFYAFFWGLYDYYRTLDIFTQLATAMLYSTIASFAALLISLAIIKIIAKRVEGEKISYRDINSKPDLAHISYESIAIVISAFCTVYGLLPFIRSVGFPFWLFAIIYIIIKCLARLIAYIIGKYVSHKAFIAIGFIAICIVIVFSAIAPFLMIAPLL
jgi:hypothetical protein